ncbi:hypothetical protein [Gallaecimonas sp. GXIMD4217]|uniref:hypothetical protein n=1 Tax=Gallaecimonas sp. GXIMD4217 TaxID=3131927 RepID=UPI00311AD1A2
MSDPAVTLWAGQFARPEYHPLRRLFRPLSWFLDFLHDLKTLLLSRFRAELTGGGQPFSLSDQLLGTAVLVVLSLLIHHWDPEGWLLLLLLLLKPVGWLADGPCRSMTPIQGRVLQRDGPFLIWTSRLAGRGREQRRIDLDAIDHVALALESDGWHSQLVHFDGEIWPLGRHGEPQGALAECRALAGRLGKPLVLAHSLGLGELAEQPWPHDRVGSACWQENNAWLQRRSRFVRLPRLGKAFGMNALLWLELALLELVLDHFGALLSFVLWEQWLGWPGLGQAIWVFALAAVISLSWDYRGLSMPLKLGRFGDELEVLEAGRPPLVLARPNQCLMIYQPWPCILVLGEQGMLVLDDWLDDREAEEVMAWLCSRFAMASSVAA